jgi:hypothetical protein
MTTNILLPNQLVTGPDGLESKLRRGGLSAFLAVDVSKNKANGRFDLLAGLRRLGSAVVLRKEIGPEPTATPGENNVFRPSPE